jgi:hypothetical protein
VDLGFPASAWSRAILGVAVAGLAGALLLLVEGGGDAVPPAGAALSAGAALPVRAQRTARLRLESGFPVAAWSVTVAGRAIPPDHSDALSWSGAVDAPAGSEVLVEASAAAPAGGPRCALRLVMDGDPQGERTAWGDGGVVATVPVP